MSIYTLRNTLAVGSLIIASSAIASIPPQGQSNQGQSNQGQSNQGQATSHERGFLATTGSGGGIAASTELFVSFTTAGVSQAPALNKRFGATLDHWVRGTSVEAVKIPATVNPQIVLNDYRTQSSVVKYAELVPVRKFTQEFVPNDPYYGVQWALPQINGPLAWGVTQGSSSIVVAVIDTGVDPTHPDLIDKLNLSQAYDFAEGKVGATDDTTGFDYGHGTHTAGDAGADTNNSIGVAGIGFNTHILPIKIAFSGAGGLDGAVIPDAIRYAADQGAKVISMSFGGLTYVQTEQDAVNYAYNRGCVLCASAGNSTSNELTYPAAYANVVSVAASTYADARAYFSNYGSWVNVAAPGFNIYSTVPHDASPAYYDYESGTSMSCPITAGTVALMIANAPTGTTNTQLVQTLLSTTDPVPNDPLYGKWVQTGRIDAYKAVLAIGPTQNVNGTIIGQPVASPIANYVEGNAASLTTAGDGNIYEVNAYTRTGLGATAGVYATFNEVPPVGATLASAVITISAQANASGNASQDPVIDQVFLLNPQTNNYDLIASVPIGTAFTTFQIPLDATTAALYATPNTNGTGNNIQVFTQALLPQRLFTGNNSNYVYGLDELQVQYQYYASAG